MAPTRRAHIKQGRTISSGRSPSDRLAVKRLVARLDGFARGLGLERAVARQVVEAVVAGMPDRDDGALIMEIRKRMLKAAA